MVQYQSHSLSTQVGCTSMTSGYCCLLHGTQEAYVLCIMQVVNLW